MTIKDIERMSEHIQGYEFYVVVSTKYGEDNIYFKNFNNLLNWVKQYYNADLTSKNNSQEKIVGVRVWH